MLPVLSSSSSSSSLRKGVPRVGVERLVLFRGFPPGASRSPLLGKVKWNPYRGTPLTAPLSQSTSPYREQRSGALAQRLGADGALAVEQLRRGAHRFPHRLVVRVPPEVAGQPRLPGVHLDVYALVEAELRVRAADARVLDAAPRALAGAVAEGVVVDPDHARLDATGDPRALLAVLGPDRGAEPELGVVGEVDRLLLGVDDDDRQHGAEDLLAHDPHLVGDAGQHRSEEQTSELQSHSF